MKTLDYLHLDEKSVAKIVSNLQELLADYQVFYTNLRGFHWNIKGKVFFELHSKFEELYNDAAIKIDEIAERILTLGDEPQNRFSEYLKLSKIAEVGGVTCSEQAVKHILEGYGMLISKEREILSLASDAADESTVSQMSDYI